LTSSTAGLAAITLFIGFCIFDGDHHGTSHHGMSPLTSALGLVVLSLAVALLGLAEVYPLPAERSTRQRG